MDKPIVENIWNSITFILEKSYDEAVIKYGEEEVMKNFPERMDGIIRKNYFATQDG